MALGGHELLLIVRAQNQASQALRRVAADTARLGNIRNMHLRQGQLAINQARTLTSRQTAMNELAAIEEKQGARNLSMKARRLSNMSQELGKINQLEKAQGRFNKLSRIGVSGPLLVQAARDVDRYQKSLDATRIRAQQLSAEELRLAQRAGILRDRIATANASLAQHAMEQREIGKAIRAQRWDRFQTGARIMTHLGRVMQMAGLVGGAALGFAAKSAADFSSQVTKVATQTGPVGSGFLRIANNAKFLQTALLGVMRQGTATRDELTSAAYDIYSSLTLRGSNMQQLRSGVDILRQINKASIAGVTPLQDVSDGVISVLGAFKEIQPTGANVHKLLERMFAAVRFGRFTFQEFAATLGTSAPAARAAGQTFNTLAGTIAFLSRPLGINKAAVGFARLTEILSREKMVTGLKALGVNIVNARGRLLQMPDVIDRITSKFPKLTRGGVALTQFFKKVSGSEGTIQARRAFVFLAQQLDRYRLVLGQTTRDNNEFDRSFSAMSRTAGVRFGIFVNRLKAFAITIGAAVLPALIKLTKPLQNLTHWFESLDSSQRANIGKYATYAAALLLFGGTVISVGGMILTFVAVLGRFGIAGSGMIVVLLAVVAAVKVLRGDWNSLSDAVTSGVNAMLGSFQGFAVGAALIVAASLKIRRAMLAMAVTGAAARAGLMGTGAAGVAGAAGRGGMLAGIGGAVTTGRLTAMYRAEAGASRLAAGLTGAAAGAAALPGPLKIAAAAIGVAALGALVWKRHMQSVEQHAERIQAFNRQINIIGQVPRGQVSIFRRAGLDMRNIVQTRNALQDVNAQVKDMRKQVAAAGAAERPGLRRQLIDLLLQQKDATVEYNRAQNDSRVSTRALSGFIATQTRLFQARGQQILNVRRMQKDLAFLRRLPAGGIPSAAERGGEMAGARAFTPREISTFDRLMSRFGTMANAEAQLTEGIHLYRASIKQLGDDAETNASRASAAFRRVLRDMQGVPGLLPSHISRRATAALTEAAKVRPAIVRQPGVMRQIIRAVADPSSLRQLPKDIQAAVHRATVTIRVQAHRAQAAKDFPQFARTLGRVVPAVAIRAKTDRQSVNAVKSQLKVFRTPIGQPIHLGPVSPNAAALGATMRQGIESGFGSVSLSVTINAHINKSITEIRKNLQAHSPSRKTARLIGVPMIEGIIQGILSKIPDLEQASTLAVDFFNGPWLTSSKFTDAKKKVHIHVADLIKDLKAQVQQFRVFNNALARLAARGVPLQLLDQLSQLGAEGADKIAKLANATQRQLSRYIRLWRAAQREIARSQRTNFDQIITNLHSFVEQAAQTLLSKYNEIADGLKSAWLDISNISQWGANQYAMSTAQILKNAQRQLAQLLQSGDLIDSLRTKGLPAELLAQLAAMGPQALPMLMGLNNMTDEQLKAFIEIWTKMHKQIDKQTMKLMKDQIKMWKKHGADIAAGIISGLMSEQEELLKFFRKLFLNLLKEARKETKSRSPSLMFGELGRDIINGLIVGLNSGGDLKIPIPRLAHSGEGNFGRSGSPVYMTVNAQHGESLMSTLERAAFRLRNRRP